MYVELRDYCTDKENGGPLQFTAPLTFRATHIHLSRDAMNHMLADKRFENLFDLEARVENVREGIFGSMLGMYLTTDAYDRPERPKLPGLKYLIYYG